MRTKSVILAIFVLSALNNCSLFASKMNEAAFLGVAFDPNPLPELLRKHLQLSCSQGLRIQNIYIESPADKAGLERDDIIIAFEGKDICSGKDLVDAIRQGPTDTDISLEIIHLGKRQNLRLRLEKRDPQFDPDSLNWKYPLEPDVAQIWRPGRMFHLKPGEKDWREIPFDEFPGHMDTRVEKFFKEKYLFQHSDGDRTYSVIIDGDPDDEDTTITLQTDSIDYTATTGTIDKLPKEYRDTVEKDVEEARKSSKKVVQPERDSFLPLKQFDKRLKDFDFSPFFDKYHPKPHLYDDQFKRMDRQMKELREQIEEMQKQQRQMLDRFFSEPVTDENPLGHKRAHIDNLPQRIRPKSETVRSAV